MSYQPSYQRERQQAQRKRKLYGPLFIGGLAIILIGVGLTLIYLSLSGAGVELSFLSTETPTPTNTRVPTETSPPPTITYTPTITLTPTLPATATASAPFLYTVQEGDTLISIAIKFGLDPSVGYLIIMDYNQMEQPFVTLGQDIIVPPPFAVLFTPTPIAPNVGTGTQILYRVLPGDFGATIAEKCYSTVEDIQAANEAEDAFFDINTIQVGQVIIVPVRTGGDYQFGDPICYTPEDLATSIALSATPTIVPLATDTPAPSPTP